MKEPIVLVTDIKKIYNSLLGPRSLPESIMIEQSDAHPVLIRYAFFKKCGSLVYIVKGWDPDLIKLQDIVEGTTLTVYKHD